MLSSHPAPTLNMSQVLLIAFSGLDANRFLHEYSTLPDTQEGCDKFERAIRRSQTDFKDFVTLMLDPTGRTKRIDEFQAVQRLKEALECWLVHLVRSTRNATRFYALILTRSTPERAWNRVAFLQVWIGRDFGQDGAWRVQNRP
jgi:hypothetical protein